MTDIVIFEKKKLDYNVGFEVSGHAGYAKRGEDIVCAAISVLTINTINSIEKFTDDKFVLKQNERTGFISFKLKGKPGDEASLLLKSMILGLTDIVKEYGDEYIRLIFKEV
jgi:uncharacterized protein YsxB (DUF464 family)